MHNNLSTTATVILVNNRIKQYPSAVISLSNYKKHPAQWNWTTFSLPVDLHSKILQFFLRIILDSTT